MFEAGRWKVLADSFLRRLSTLYVPLALVMVFCFSVLTPPIYVPDEWNHAARSMQVAAGQITVHDAYPGAGAPVDVNLADYIARAHATLKIPPGSPPDPVKAQTRDAELASLRTYHWAKDGRTKDLNFQNTEAYPPTFYLPQALSWTVGRRLDLTLQHTLILARALAGLVAVLVGWCALRLCAWGRPLLFCFLLFPGVLTLMGSCSQDGQMLACAALAAALITRPMAARRQFAPWELLLAVALIAACAMSRPPYLLLAAALLLPSLEMRPLQWRPLAVALGGAVAVMLSLLAWRHAVRLTGTFLGPAANPPLQVAFLRAHPAGALHVLVVSTLQFLKLIAGSFFVISGNSVTFPDWYRLPVILAVVVLCLLLAGDGVRRVPGRLLLAGALAGTVFGMVAAEYVIWTAPGGAAVDGLQTRYLLPVLPFLFALPFWQTERVRSLRCGPVLVAAAVMVFTVVTLTMPWVLAHRLHGAGLAQAMRYALLS